MPALKKQYPGNVLQFEKRATFSIECIDNLDYMRALPNESMHLIVTSPPIWVISARMRREDRTYISFHPLADLGR